MKKWCPGRELPGELRQICKSWLRFLTVFRFFPKKHSIKHLSYSMSSERGVDSYRCGPKMRTTLTCFCRKRPHSSRVMSNLLPAEPTFLRSQPFKPESNMGQIGKQGAELRPKPVSGTDNSGERDRQSGPLAAGGGLPSRPLAALAAALAVFVWCI